MGGVQLCYSTCDNLIANKNTRKWQLRSKYKTYLKGNQFKNLCIQTLDRHFNQELQLQEEEQLRHSFINSNHYETNCFVNSLLTQDSIDITGSIRGSVVQDQKGGLRFSVSSNSQKKQTYMLNLIKQSYLFLDISECLEERKSFDMYQRCIKKEVLGRDGSLTQSFASDVTLVDRLQESLRANNGEMLVLLQDYVRFCRRVNHDFMAQNDRFLGNLCLNLQASLISKYQQKEFRNNSEYLLNLRQDIFEVINILVFTIETLFAISIKKDLQQTTIETKFDFYNELNIHTMVTSLLFKNEEFTNFIINKIRLCFSQRFNKFKNDPPYKTHDFVQDFINLSTRSSRRSQQFRSQIQFLTDPKAPNYSRLHVFQKCLRILPKIYDKPQPLYKLKLIYQLNKQMCKQLEHLKQQLWIQYKIQIQSVFNRQTELLIIKWLLKHFRHQIDRYGAHLLFTYFFIHHIYKMDKKGSSLTTFMQQIERIIQWNELNY